MVWENHSPNDGTIANGLSPAHRLCAVAAWMEGQAAHVRFGSKADIEVN